jgi:hypothetical protein
MADGFVQDEVPAVTLGAQLPSVDAAEIHDLASRHWPTGVVDLTLRAAIEMRASFRARPPSI